MTTFLILSASFPIDVTEQVVELLDDSGEPFIVVTVPAQSAVARLIGHLDHGILILHRQFQSRKLLRAIAVKVDGLQYVFIQVVITGCGKLRQQQIEEDGQLSHSGRP